MEFGIALPPVAGSWKTAKRAEELGFSRAWFYDTPMLNAELFTILGATAMATSKIRLGTGVLVPGGRIAPVAASGLATLNALAPGRIDFGVGTGFTARRTMGLNPVKLEVVEDYVRVVTGLLRGETLEWSERGPARKVRFLDPSVGAINLDDPIALHIAAFGPRGRELVARLGAGWIGSGGDPETAGAELGRMKADWAKAGRPADTLFSSCTLSGMPLREGEGFDSARVMAHVGPYMTTALHGQAEMEDRGGGGFGRGPAATRPSAALERYREIYNGYDRDAPYLENHRGHAMYLRPDEVALCTPQMIRDYSWTASKSELRQRLRSLKASGYRHAAISVGLCRPEGLLEDWMDVIEGM
jgi:5,10-methylenetetrahydromethanopterin reductase